MFYKFVNRIKADELIAVGFKHTIEYIDRQKVYSFLVTPELEKYVGGKFSKSDFFVDNKMRF